MYLINKTAYIKQILPPHWRNTWREVMLSVLLTPVFSLERQFAKFRNDIIEETNMSSQVLVLDEAVKKLSGSYLSNISDGDFEIKIYLPAGVERKNTIDFARKYVQAGVKISVEIINE